MPRSTPDLRGNTNRVRLAALALLVLAGLACVGRPLPADAPPPGDTPTATAMASAIAPIVETPTATPPNIGSPAAPAPIDLPGPTATSRATAEPTSAPAATSHAPVVTPPPKPPAANATLAPTPAKGSCGPYPCADDIAGWEARLRVPPGFSGRHLVTVNGHPTSLTYAPDGRLVVATMEGTIFAYDAAGHAAVIASGFHLPIGLAYRPGTSDLYVASRTFPRDAFPNEGKVTIVRADGSQQDIVTGLPCCYTSDMHQPNSLAFGPDGKVYLSIGALSDHGEQRGQPDVFGEIQPLEAGILRFNADGSGVERYAAGLRNPYDLAFDAAGRLYATDNGPDFGAPDRLVRVVQGAHYGFPYYADCALCPPAPADLQITPPLATFISHGAATGITAYTGNQFPADYADNLFVTLWSSFPGAQKVLRIQLSPFRMSDFVLGLADPIDVAVAPDGALVVADWATGHVFKISYARQ